MSLSSHATLTEAAKRITSPIFLHHFFEQAAHRWPERTALDIPPTSMRGERLRVSYAELERQADTVAAKLGSFISQESVVAILLPKSVELYASQLAALKAGAAYTCIDPAFPNEQLRDILQDSEAVAVLTD
ncbi:MAG: AMP-binding protein, partial [Blastocatellia bacterium]